MIIYITRFMLPNSGKPKPPDQVLIKSLVFERNPGMGCLILYGYGIF